MIFVYAIVTPANTPASNPQFTRMPVAAGTITRMGIQFPLGVSALAHISISNGLNQVFPNNPAGSFATSNETIEWEEEFDLLTPPYELQAYTWNTDPNWQHTITVRIVMTPAEPGSGSLLDQVKSLLGVGS